MALKYDNLRFYWAVVTEKRLNSVNALKFYTINRPFLWP